MDSRSVVSAKGDTMKRLGWIVLALALALAWSRDSAKGQEPPAKADDEMTVAVTGTSDADFPEIAVEFEVKRPDGSFLLDATKADFKITEEGRDVEIKTFEAPTSVESRPTTIVLVVDRSGSMSQDDKIGGLKRAVASFLDGLPKGSKVAVVAFGSEVSLISPLTTDFAQVQSAVEELTPDGATRFYDGVLKALEVLEEERGRRAVLALTDGMDTSSQNAGIPSLITQARRLGLPIHTLGFGSERNLAGDSLRTLAESTRGQYYTAQEADKLRLIYEEIAKRLRSSYTATYQTDRKIPDGTLRPVRVAYRQSRSVGESAVFIPGMVVPAPGWPGLFLALVLGLFVVSGAARRWI